MYLADALLTLARSEGKVPLELATQFDFVRGRAREIISDYDLYALDRSALRAAADIRLDKVAGFEGMVDYLFSEPRKIFIECDYKERDEELDHFTYGDEERPEKEQIVKNQMPARVASLIESYGGGRGKVSTIWMLPKKTVRDEFSAYLRSLPRGQYSAGDIEALETAVGLGATFHHVGVDISKRRATTKDEFLQALAEGDGLATGVLNLTRQVLQATKGGERDEMEAAWREYRRNIYLSLELSDSNRRMMDRVLSDFPAEQRSDAEASMRADLDGEFIFALACASIIQVDNISTTFRPPVKRPPMAGKVKSPVSGRKASVVRQEDRLAIVSMVIDKEVEKAMDEERRAARVRSVNADGSVRKAPALHFVRGHLFRARNGKVVYRKPHLRGKQIDTATLTRVRAM